MGKYTIIDNMGLLRKLEDNTETWWTNVILDNAYEIVEDRKYPILIPTYNNPNPPAVQGFLSRMDEQYNYPIILFVRDSQKNDYISANRHPYVTVVSAPDEYIDSAGKARWYSLKWLYLNGYHHAFSFDDDALDLGLTERGFTGKGDPKSQAIKHINNIAKVLAVWQLSMEKLEEQYNNVILTGVYPLGFSWKEEYCQLDQSALLYRGNLNQVVCLNVNNLLQNGITYRDNRICGHEDIDLILQGLQKNMLVATFPFIWYSTPPMDVDNFSYFGKTMEDRFKAQQELMLKSWGEESYATFKDKRGLAQVSINFRKYRKDNGINEYVINLFKDNLSLIEG